MSTTLDTETKQFVVVYIERLPDDAPTDAKYHIHGLPEGKSFRDERNYETLACECPKLNGASIATEYLELSEHDTVIEVTLGENGHTARIEW
jgi:hypothetical protein